jgi:hypothetical protein
VGARKRRSFTGVLLKPIDLGDAKPRGLRESLAAPPDKSDIQAHLLKEISARYIALDKFLGIHSNTENIWEQRAKALLAYEFDIPAHALQSWEHLTRYLTNRYVPAFRLKTAGEKKRGDTCQASRLSHWVKGNMVPRSNGITINQLSCLRISNF